MNSLPMMNAEIRRHLRSSFAAFCRAKTTHPPALLASVRTEDEHLVLACTDVVQHLWMCTLDSQDVERHWLEMQVESSLGEYFDGLGAAFRDEAVDVHEEAEGRGIRLTATHTVPLGSASTALPLRVRYTFSLLRIPEAERSDQLSRLVFSLLSFAMDERSPEQERLHESELALQQARKDLADEQKRVEVLEGRVAQLRHVQEEEIDSEERSGKGLSLPRPAKTSSRIQRKLLNPVTNRRRGPVVRGARIASTTPDTSDVL